MLTATAMEIPVRMRQTRTPDRKWKSHHGLFRQEVTIWSPGSPTWAVVCNSALFRLQLRRLTGRMQLAFRARRGEPVPVRLAACCSGEFLGRNGHRRQRPGLKSALMAVRIARNRPDSSRPPQSSLNHETAKLAKPFMGPDPNIRCALRAQRSIFCSYCERAGRRP
jgi:hypothetical protein